MFNSLKIAVIKSLVKRKLGQTIRPIEIMSANPDILFGYVKFMQTLMNQHRVDEKLKALVRVRAANLSSAHFESTLTLP